MFFQLPFALVLQVGQKLLFIILELLFSSHIILTSHISSLNLLEMITFHHPSCSIAAVGIGSIVHFELLELGEFLLLLGFELIVALWAHCKLLIRQRKQLRRRNAGHNWRIGPKAEVVFSDFAHQIVALLLHLVVEHEFVLSVQVFCGVTDRILV